MKTIFACCLVPALLGTLAAGAAQAQRPFFGGPPPRGVLHWSGDVDDTTIITLHGDQVRDRAMRGKGVDDENVNLVGRLPHRPVFVTLRDRDGRGQVRIVEQPRPDNDFTAAVRIHDPQPGRGHYRFTLTWRPLPRRDEPFGR